MPGDQKKPVVLFIINRLVIGGQAYDTISLAYHLQQNFEVHVLYGCKEKDEEEALFLINKNPGITYKKVDTLKRSINIINDIRSYVFIRRYIKKTGSHIVHTHGSKSGLTGRLAAYVQHVPCIIHTFHGHVFHSYYNRFTSSLIKKMEHSLARITTKLVTLSTQQHFEITSLYKIAPANKTVIIPLGMDVNELACTKNALHNPFRKEYNITGNQLSIGIVGRMVAIKNYSLFIEILIKLHHQYHDKLRFFFIGDGELKPLLQQRLQQSNIAYTEQKNSDVSVTFTSWMQDAQQAISGLDIVVLTSLNEGTPLSLIEAQACGTPVVAANVGGVKDTMIDNETGFLINSHNADDYVSKLKLLIDDDALRNNMAAKGKAFIKEKFSKQKQVDAIVSLYKNCL